MATAKIIPATDPRQREGGPTYCHGTVVRVGEEELDGVTSITLSAKVGQTVWEATIVCTVQPPEELMADFVSLGIEDEIDNTTLRDHARMYVKRP